MLMAIESLLAILALAICNIEGGSIDESFLKSFKGANDTKNAIVEFPEVLPTVLNHPDLISLQGDARRSKIVNLLQEATASTQRPIMTTLTTFRLAHKVTAFWVANKIAIKDAPLSALTTLADIPGVFRIRKEETANAFPIEVGKPVIEVEETKGNADTKLTYQWGVDKIGAHLAFLNRINGTGVIVGIIDSGVRATHIALRTNYKNDIYSWKDAINNRPNPYDDNGHGTHCAGIAVGTANGIGVAPGAKWIACKGLNSAGSGSETQLTTCGQFMACPKRSTSGDCSGFPNIVSNSWGGGNDDDFYNSVITSWVAINIIPVFAIGNAGPNCGTANSPGDQPNLISVGSTDSNDAVSSFSSRGPGGPLSLRPKLLGIKKPEVAAPGRDIISADSTGDTGYITHSGTSMATPNVAGAAALILSTNINLSFAQVRDKLQQNTVKNTAGIACKLPSSPTYPNNEYGNGRISVQKALNIP